MGRILKVVERLQCVIVFSRRVNGPPRHDPDPEMSEADLSRSIWRAPRRLTSCSRRAAFAALTPPPTDSLGSAAACGSTWSLADMRPPHPRKTGKTFVEDEVSLERIFVGDKDDCLLYTSPSPRD